MTYQEYSAMYRAVPGRHGLAAVGNAFLLEATDRAKKATTREEIDQVAALMLEKWRQFCEATGNLDPAPQPHAFDGLRDMLLRQKGF